MARFGYTLMTEQAGPKELVRHAVRAEEVGFDFEVMSDHYSPWLTEQGHAPYAWSVLGAVAHATERVGLMTYVTCPTVRYHPAVVAQKAATIQILADGRFTLGLGSGESLNEHVVGEGWPSIDTRQDMLQEAVSIIRALLAGDLVSWQGEYFDGRRSDCRATGFGASALVEARARPSIRIGSRRPDHRSDSDLVGP